MIRSISFQEFKQFSSYTVGLQNRNVLVGPNNAGKSTVLDGLRVASAFISFANRRTGQNASLSSLGPCKRYQLSENALPIPLSNVVRNFGEGPAIIEVRNTRNRLIRIELSHSAQPTAYLSLDGDKPPKLVKDFKKLFPERISIVPTLSPFEEKEPYISDERVKIVSGSRLASRNFRNIWLRESDANFEELREVIRSVWPKIWLQKPETHFYDGNRFVQMFYREGNSTRELYWSGFGFQVWMQMIAQAILSSETETIVLDEPDIYLHPDLQKRLYDYLANKFDQVILATHSTEIINHAESKAVVLIDSEKQRTRRISDEADFRNVYSALGASDNVEFARLAKAKRVLFFEGKDRNLLRAIARKVGLAPVLNNPDILYLKSGGFGGWRKVRDTDWVIKQTLGMDVKVFALFDRDYKSDNEVLQFEEKVSKSNINCRVLPFKEIENVVLKKNLLRRYIQKTASNKSLNIDQEYIDQLLDRISEEFRLDVMCQRQADEMKFRAEQARLRSEKLPDQSVVNKEVAQYIELIWSDFDKRARLLPGKSFLARLATHLSDRFGINLSYHKLINEMVASEIEPEIKSLLIDIQDHLQI